MRVKVIYSPEEEGGFSVAAPALPGCYSQGDNLDEARAMIREAAAGWLDVAREKDDCEPLTGPAAEDRFREVLATFGESAAGDPVIEELEL